MQWAKVNEYSYTVGQGSKMSNNTLPFGMQGLASAIGTIHVRFRPCICLMKDIKVEAKTKEEVILAASRIWSTAFPKVKMWAMVRSPRLNYGHTKTLYSRFQPL